MFKPLWTLKIDLYLIIPYHKNVRFYFAKVQANATIPERATSGSAGYDLSSCEEALVPARGYKMINTGIATQFPIDHYARIAPRSGLTLKRVFW